jgi:hypothetical protein
MEQDATIIEHFDRSTGARVVMCWTAGEELAVAAINDAFETYQHPTHGTSPIQFRITLGPFHSTPPNPIPFCSASAVDLSLSSRQRRAAACVISTLRPIFILSGPIPIDQSLYSVGTLIRCSWQNSSTVSAPSRANWSAE